ncbi:MAG: hypothetical protein OEX83_06795 [Gammaproteobacteria bacterium]|nr:hypothetical protein [Gammaproteobacteria bacterium]
MKISKDISWWYWLATIPMLVVGVSGNDTGFFAAMGLTSIQVVHYLMREKNIAAFPVQVRIGYLLLLVCGSFPYLFWIYWIQIAGTSAMVIFNYCPLARILSLMPWNRTELFSMNLMMHTFFSRPIEGNILQGLPEK